MNQHSQFAYGNASKKWWDRETIFGLTKNDLIMGVIALIFLAAYGCLNWDVIVALCTY